ncbi:MAG: hypothetical protein HYV75_05260 [Opitutae bacterium]|nr:hypothetical protein [Opitutae bacterium]
METNHRQGRPGAGERALQRAHARQLLLTLAGICRRLRTKRMNPAAQSACREVEKELRQFARRKS